MEEEKKQRLIHPETEQKSGGIGGKGGSMSQNMELSKKN